ncbi:MAG: acyltransferase [Bacteroidota bacterium]|nr:acyltransferase [Bacteroidota bacterium]MDP4232160.1 acyltransferase [Bacteroidota bacterium]MDP4241132.1 acyltransferase [Bacteroidota bacterium]MDP4286524.1 acyltransferase [Bacteroidota bacterium]
MPQSSNPAGTKVRLDSIDALRGIAALMVAGYHIWGHYGIYPFPSLGVVPYTSDAGFFAYLVSPLRWGYLGVSLFLVLSGFCIHLPFARRKQSGEQYDFNARAFYLRRLWRLYPAYAVSVIGTFLLLTLLYPTTSTEVPSHNLGDLLSHLTLTQGYFDRYFYSIVNVYWSLALEFQLYLLYPIFLYSFYKLGATRAVAVLTVVALAWRIVSLDVFHYQLISISWTGPYAMMGSVLARMPEWLFGAWLAEWYVHGGHQKARRMSLAFISALILLLAILSSLDQRLWSLTDILFGLGFAYLIGASITPRKAVIASKEPTRTSWLATNFYRRLVWIGTISYSLYLFHAQLSWIANPWIRTLPGTILPFALRTVVLILSIPVIAFIYRFVEAPFLKAPRLGERFHKLYARLEHQVEAG